MSTEEKSDQNSVSASQSNTDENDS